jgi:hypothetical protein
MIRRPMDVDRKPSTARWAALAFLPLPLIPLVGGGLTVLSVLNGPAPGCFEYCEFDQKVAQVLLALGLIGVLIAIGVWRRRVAAMALALFVSAVAAMIVVVSVVLGWGTIGSDPVRFWPLFAFLLLFAAPAVLLVRALADAADAAAAAVTVGPDD